MKRFALLLAAVILIVARPTMAETTPGRMKGGEIYSLPSWFKPSFMDFRSEVDEARQQGRHVMAFLHLDECPYCARMLKENFVSGDNRDFMEKHFDVIGVNIQGNLEVTWIDGATYTERTLARRLGAFATPTIVFLDPDGNKVLQLVGYRDPRTLRHALEYVQGKSYGNQTFAAYLAARDQPPVYALRAHPRFTEVVDFKGYDKPLAILFEDRHCADCARFHDKTLSRLDVMEEMGKYLFVRLDSESNRQIVDLKGATTTPAQWAKDLKLSYRPAVVLFNEGREIYRIDWQLYQLHFREALRYVSGGHYKQFGSLSQYKTAYRAELLKSGVDIDFAE